MTTVLEVPLHTFEETGEGCEAHADPNCLCDVVISQPVAVKFGFTDVLFGTQAALMAGPVDTPHAVVDWAARAMSWYDRARDVRDAVVWPTTPIARLKHPEAVRKARDAYFNYVLDRRSKGALSKRGELHEQRRMAACALSSWGMPRLQVCEMTYLEAEYVENLYLMAARDEWKGTGRMCDLPAIVDDFVDGMLRKDICAKHRVSTPYLNWALSACNAERAVVAAIGLPPKEDLTGLSRNERAIWKLMKREGATVTEVASAMDMHRKWVANMWGTAQAKMEAKNAV